MAYLDTIKAGAVSTWQTHQVLPSVVGAQAALESGWGTSKLAKPPYNNQFGIKASDDWTGRTVTMPTREYTGAGWVTSNEPFRAYDSAGDSVKDHGAFFTSTPWRKENYKAVVGETDYKKACWALQNAPAPYATDPGYAQKLINLIENNNLQAWDREALADNSNTVATQAQQTIVSKMVGADLTDAGKQYVRDLDVTMIGDSLGVGTKPYFESLVPKANYDVLGSRQITHATNSLNGTYILQQMKNAGTLKEYVVVILGTNRGVTEQEVNNFASIAGDNHKVIFVDTASEVAHINTLSVYYQDAAKRLNNVYFANWRLKSNSLKPQYYSKDGANGEYIHMTPLGYQKHAEFIAQALYEVATANFTDRVAEATKVEFYTIENFELNEDGLITYDAWRVNADGTSTKYKATKQTAIKGLYSPYGESNIYNPSANQQYGLGNSVNNSNWRETYFEDSEETDGLKLVEKASAELIERQEPEMIYTVNLLEIPVELSIGDTGIFVDHEFNPPLYLRARVLSLTTSETNATLNRVTIGNVTELHPQDKSQLLAVRAEMQEVRKDLEANWIDAVSTDMTIVSTNGYVLGDRTRETTLVAKVIKGKDDITDQYEVFRWERISGDPVKDAEFNTALSDTVQSSVLSVYEKDIIGNQSKFVARAYNAAGDLVSHQEIVIKRIETALWVDTDTEPSDATDGATWTKPDGSQWVKVDGIWEETVKQSTVQDVYEDIDRREQELSDSIDLAQTKADDAYLEATGASSATANLAGLVTDVKTTADNAWLEVGVIGGQMTESINKADDALARANAIPTTIDTIILDRGLTTGTYVDTRIDEVTGDIFHSIESVSGSIPTIVLGVEWDKSESPELTRIDDVTDLVGRVEYEIQTADFAFTLDGFSADLQTISTNKLNADEFTNFKSNDYDLTVAGISSNLQSLETNKLSSSTFTNFKDSEYDAMVSDVAGDLNDLRNNKMNTTEFTTFKTNDYDLTVDGISADISNLQTGKLNSLDFTNFKTNDYDVTVQGISADIIDLSTSKLDSQIFSNFKTNDFDVTVDGIYSEVSEVRGAYPRLIMGVEWDKSDSPNMERTDDTEILDLSALYPDVILGVEWDKESDPTLERTDYAGEAPSLREYEIFKGDYEFSKTGWEATTSYITDNKTEINSLISNAQGWQSTISYVDDNRIAFNDTIAQVNSYVQTIGDDGGKIAQMVMSDAGFQNVVTSIEGSIADFTVGVEWDKKASPTMLRTGLMDNYASTRFAQLDDSFIMSITDASGLKTSINATTDGIRFKGELLHLDGQTTMSEAFIQKLDALEINADRISGGTITGANFSTTASADNFTIELKNGIMSFKRAIFTMGTINLTKDANTLQPNGFAITQRPGHMFNIASVYNDGSTTSSPVLQIPANSDGASKKLNIYAQGGLYIDSDSFDLNSTVATFNVPLVLMNGLRASHTYNGTTISDAGNLMYVVDKDSSGVMFHRLGIRTKSGDWLSSRFEFYEDGRLARVANGVRTFF